VIAKITRGNAFLFFGVDSVAELGAANCTVASLREQARGVDTATQSMEGKDARVMGDPKRAVNGKDVWATLTERRRQCGRAETARPPHYV
jgi:hypothetical protein